MEKSTSQLSECCCCMVHFSTLSTSINSCKIFKNLVSFSRIIVSHGPGRLRSQSAVLQLTVKRCFVRILLGSPPCLGSKACSGLSHRDDLTLILSNCCDGGLDRGRQSFENNIIVTIKLYHDNIICPSCVFVFLDPKPTHT